MRSNVRGPNSALTEFLRSRGIRIPNQGRVAPARVREGEEEADVAAAPADLTGVASTENSEPSQQEQLDAAVAQELASQLEGATPEASTSKAKSKKRKKGVEDEAYEPEEEPDYGRSGFSRKSRPAAGQIDFCAECNCRFTVTIYNKSTEAGLLCSACGSVEASKRTNLPVKPRPAVKKKRAKAVLDGEIDRIPKLQDVALKCIAAHITDIEAFGDIGQINMDKICQIISRNRCLTNETVTLFLDASRNTLTLYDCAKITPDRLKLVAQLCPRLTSLRLHMAGQIMDATLQFYGHHLSDLTELALRGCFLITTSGWCSFFETVGDRLQMLEISDTARFDAQAAEALVKFCPNLKELSLARLTQMNDAVAEHLAKLRHLTKLDISYAGAEMGCPAICHLLSCVGPQLESLNLAGLRFTVDSNPDDILATIAKDCRRLEHLDLGELDGLTNQGIETLFGSWANTPLLSLQLERCSQVIDTGLEAILKHSGSSLRLLNLNSLDEITNEGIARIAQPNALPQVTSLDVSWIRAMDDVVFLQLLRNAKSLRKVLVWGNNRITDLAVPSLDAACLVVGRESSL